jgi:hypothetical protein
MKALKFAVAAAAALLASAANAEWHEARTNHFIVYSEGKQAEVAAFAERLERFDNAMRVVQRMPTNEVIPDIAKVHVFRFGDTSDIGALAGSRGVAGFYIPHAARPVAFTPAREFKDRRSLERTLEDPTFSAEVVLFHEYTHHFMLKNFATTYPGWYIEGFAEANATIMLRPDGSFVYGMPANHRARELTELPQLHVRKLLDPAYEFKSGTEAIQKYSLGWLLTHYLAFSKDRAGQMQTYLSLLGKGTPGMAAAEQAFGDLDSLNREKPASARGHPGKLRQACCNDAAAGSQRRADHEAPYSLIARCFAVRSTRNCVNLVGPGGCAAAGPGFAGAGC